MLTTIGVIVSIRRDGGSWVVLNGYTGGLLLGMTSEKILNEGDDDGVARYFKGSSNGAESQIAVRLIESDPGQVLLRALCEHDDDGLGGVRMAYPQGIVIFADGLFHGLVENIADPDAYQGFTASFTQNEPENRS